MILFHCPRCQKGLKAEDRLAGLVGYCPACGGTLLFPGDRALPAGDEAAPDRVERAARRQGRLDRLRQRVTLAWLLSLVVHAAVVSAFALLTYRAATEEEGAGHAVRILLGPEDRDGALQYRGPRDLVLEERRSARADALADLGRERAPADLIEVGPARGAPTLRLTDLDFDQDRPAGGFSTQFMEIGARGQSFIYIVDRSGSMDAGSPKRLDVAKAELRSSVEMLPAEALFHVIFYHSQNQEPQVVEMPAQGLVRASRANKDRLAQAVEAVDSFGGTNPLGAFRKAFRERPDVIFFLTDGLLTVEVPDIVRRIRDMNRELARDRVTIHTVGLVEQTGEAILQQIARENRGVYRYIDEAAAARLMAGRRAPPAP